MLTSGSGRDEPVNPMFGKRRGMVAGGGGVIVGWDEGVTVSQCQCVSVSWYDCVTV
jgi:hypothetical protein